MIRRPETSILGKPVGEVTLRELVQPIFEVLFVCRHCQNAAAIEAVKLIGQAGPDAKIETVRFKMKCVRCGRRRAAAMLRSAYVAPPMGPMGEPPKRA